MTERRLRLLLATTNAGKLREFTELLVGLDLELVTPADLGSGFDVEETGTTFAENAADKALAWADHTGLPALADDSGLEVDALNGEPGVLSARWAPGSDEDRMLALLERLDDAAEPAARSARYKAVAAFALPGESMVSTAEGNVEGRIARDPRGAGGFGYDPIFLVFDGGHAGDRTMAELTPDEKNALSHRARAVRGLVPSMRQRLGTHS